MKQKTLGEMCTSFSALCSCIASPAMAFHPDIEILAMNEEYLRRFGCPDDSDPLSPTIRGVAEAILTPCSLTDAGVFNHLDKDVTLTVRRILSRRMSGWMPSVQEWRNERG